MTVTIKQEHIGNNYIEISQDKYSSAFKVTLSHTIDGDLYRLDKESIYTTLKAAQRRFNDLKKGL